jgi:hypothetical protein
MDQETPFDDAISDIEKQAPGVHRDHALAGLRRQRERFLNAAKGEPQQEPKPGDKDYYNPGNYCVLPRRGTRYCQERWCEGCRIYREWKEAEDERG